MCLCINIHTKLITNVHTNVMKSSLHYIWHIIKKMRLTRNERARDSKYIRGDPKQENNE